jgi:hypothetical protein
MTVQEQLLTLARDLVAGDVNIDLIRAQARAALDLHAEVKATPAEIETARSLFDQGDEIEVDDDALTSRPGGDEGGIWVQGWLWCPDV